MPDPNQTNPNQPTNPAVPVGVPAPSVFPQSDLPPLPPDFQNVSNDTGSAALPTEALAQARPSDLPPVISPSPKKKFGGGRIIATILGVLLLVGGVGAGLILTQQQQLFNQKASSCNALCLKNATPAECGCTGNQAAKTGVILPPPNTVEHFAGESGTSINLNTTTNGNGNYVRQDGTLVDANNTPVTNPCPAPGKIVNGVCVPAGYCQNNTGNCYVTSHIGADKNGDHVCDAPHWTTCAAGYTCSNQDCVPITTTPTGGEATNTIAPTAPPVVSTLPPGQTAVCTAVTAYNSTWIAQTSTQLSTLKSGDIINFCVNGTASAGTFDKAKFTINGVVQAETTTVRPSSTDFCQSYTIPAGISSFNVTAQIHHATLGWSI